MSNLINTNYEIKETAQPISSTNTVPAAYSGISPQFRGTESGDSFEFSDKKKQNNILLTVGLSILALCGIGLGILKHRGEKVLGENAKFWDKVKQGWKEFRGKGKSVKNESGQNSRPNEEIPHKPEQSDETINKFELSDLNEKEAAERIRGGYLLPEPKINQQELYDKMLKLGKNVKERPNCFQVTQTEIRYLDSKALSRNKKCMPATPQMRSAIQAIYEDERAARELAGDFMHEIKRTPEYMEKKKAIIDLNNKGYSNIYTEEDLDNFPPEIRKAFEQGQREFPDGADTIRFMTDAEYDSIYTGTTYLNDGKIRLDYQIGEDGHIAQIACNDTTKPMNKKKASNMDISCLGENLITTIRVSNREGSGTIYQYKTGYIPKYWTGLPETSPKTPIFDSYSRYIDGKTVEDLKFWSDRKLGAEKYDRFVTISQYE